MRLHKGFSDDLTSAAYPPLASQLHTNVTGITLMYFWSRRYLCIY